MTIMEIIQQVEKLSLSEQHELMNLLRASLHQSEASLPQHSILELAGLGAEIWEGIDPQVYVNQLRHEMEL